MSYTLCISGRVYSLLVIKSQILFYLGKDTVDFLIDACVIMTNRVYIFCYLQSQHPTNLFFFFSNPFLFVPQALFSVLGGKRMRCTWAGSLLSSS